MNFLKNFKNFSRYPQMNFFKKAFNNEEAKRMDFYWKKNKVSWGTLVVSLLQPTSLTNSSPKVLHVKQPVWRQHGTETGT